MISSGQSQKPDDVVAHNLIESQSSKIGITTMDIARHVVAQNYHNLQDEDRKEKINSLRISLPKMLTTFPDIGYLFGPTKILTDEGKAYHIKEQKGWRKVQTQKPDIPDEALVTKSLSETRNLTVVLNEFKTTFEEVRIITKPQTKAAHLEDLHRNLSDLCEYSEEWNEAVEPALRDLFTYMENDFEDPNYCRTYLEILLDILSVTRTNNTFQTAIKTKFGTSVHTMWEDPAIVNSKGMVSVYLITLLLYFHDFDLRYALSLMHSAINEWNTERFWILHSALYQHGILQLSKQEQAKKQIRAFIIKEEENAEGKEGNALDRATKFEQLFQQHFMW